MESALIISSQNKSVSYFSEILTAIPFEKIVVSSNANEARRILIQCDFDLCIINSPLPDEYGDELAETIAEKGISSVIICVKADIFDGISSKVEDYGVITVSKPFNRNLFWNALKIAISMNKRMKLIQKENNALIQKIEDIKIIDRAKCALISYLSMSESEAHHYIEKQAMDSRLSKRDIALRILQTYGN